jgi:class 3 adenylate cyclase/predicted ATPase
MTFDEILDRTLAMLQRRGRVSYRALKRQFNLDDAYLDDLKAEIIEVLRLAVDQDNTMLVWTGSSDTPPTPPSPATSGASQPAPQAEVATAPVSHHTPEAERRQLTVMFCDLVDSTALSTQLDPEDLREVVRAYQTTCADVIQRFDGHIAQYLGDGLLVYFGYPQAHEDDAQRAVRAGLGILAAMETHNAHLEQHYKVRLAVRLGIHTGLAVVGEMGSGARREQLALGETPNLAARLEGLASPNTVVISAATWSLVREYFTYDDLGTHVLKGIATPVQAYRVLRESGVQSRLDAAVPRGLTPLVGREHEVGQLREHWQHVQDGMGQVVILSGEAGIGKSRLVQELKDYVAPVPHTRLECRASPYYQNTALYPVIDLLQRALRWQPDDTPHEKLRKLETTLSQYSLALAEAVPLLAALVSLALPDDRYPPLTLTPQRQRQKTMETLRAILLAAAARQPVLFIVEDLHWVDPTTLEFLTLLIDQGPTVPILIVLTCRPEFQPPWGLRAHITPMVLPRLSPLHVETMVARLTGEKALPPEMLQQLLVKTDGVPLFVEELTKTVLESGFLRAAHDRYELAGTLPPLAIPTSLHDALMARLDRLATVKSIAQLAASLGRQFPYDLLQAVSQLDETTLQHTLGQLVQAELLYQQGVPPQATYLFKHALIQDAAYQSLLKSTRQQYHQRIAQVLTEQFPETAATQPELLAHHYTEAGLTEQAIPYWQRAGQHACDRSAYLEAISHVTTGIELLASLPETPARTQHALTLYITLGAALLMTKGHTAPEVEHAYTQAYALCQQVGETPELVPVLLGLVRFYGTRAQFHTARELADTLLRLAHRTQDPALTVIAHQTRGAIWLATGALPAARRHFEAGLARYTPDQHRAPMFRSGNDSGVVCYAYNALTLWLLGYPEQAMTHIHEALALAHALSHPFSLAFAWCWAAMVSQMRRDVSAAYEQAEAAVTLSTEHGFPGWAALSTLVRGWALAMQGHGEAGMFQGRQRFAAFRATGAALFVPYCCAVLADIYAHLGRTAESLQALAEAHTFVAQQEERWWEVEVARLRGVVLLQQPMPPQAEAETWLQRALDVARRQQAKSLELRAAMSLAHLWQHQGKRAQARELLAPVYGWFTEGFDTADLQDAKALLEELA